MQRGFKTCIRYKTKKRKRAIRKKLKLYHSWKPFSYSITENKPLVTKRAYKFRSKLKKLKKSLIFFYGIRKTRSSLRKLFIHSSYKSKKTTTEKIQAYLEKRADVLFYRSAFTDGVRETRRFIKKKKCYYIIPGSKNKPYNNKLIIYPHMQIPVFTFFKMTPLISLQRKAIIRNMFLAKNKLYALAPQWIYFNYNSMLGLLIRNPLPKTKFPFANSRNVAAFLGSAKYL